MGKDKLTLPWKTSTVLAHVLSTTLEAVQSLPKSLSPEVPEVIVVARQRADECIPKDLFNSFSAAGGKWVVVPCYQPLAEIIKIGLQGLGKTTCGVGFIPGDQVGLNSPILSLILETFLTTKPEFLVPVSDCVSGSPVIFHQKYVPALLQLQGEQGGKYLLRKFPESWSTIPVNDSFFSDVDTPEQYLQLYEQLHS